MKLLYVLGSYYPAQSGGPNNTIHWQAKSLVEKGVNVTVVSLKTGLNVENINDFDIVFNKESNVEGVNAIYFDFFKNRYLSFKLYIWLMRNITKFDFVQLTSYFFPISWLAAILCLCFRTPFSLAPRGELEENAIKFSSKRKNFLHKLFLKKVFDKASFIMVTSQQELQFVRPFFKSSMNYKLIPNYIDMSNNKLLDDVDILRKRNFLYLGRIHPKKGIENLINAYISLDSSIKNSHKLNIVGSGSDVYLESLKQLVNSKGHEKYVFFLGHKQGVEKSDLYKSSKVFILPSFSENFGNVVVESLSYCTPVIASNFTPWEVLIKRQCGFWITNNPNEIAQKMSDFVKMDPSEYLNYAKNSFTTVDELYNINTNVEKLILVYSRENHVK
jgi:glycosyltransferase involved in cell wall biosynthesis